MTISLQSRNLLVSYIQMYLKEYSGITLIENSRHEYEISQSRPIKVTGVYNEQTYSAVCIFMAFNYPNEGFPVRWDYLEGSVSTWTKTPYDSAKLKLTMDQLLSTDTCKGTDAFTQEDYDESMKNIEDKSEYLTYDELVLYFNNSDGVYDALISNKIKEFSQTDLNDVLIKFIVNNLNQSQVNASICDLDSRILAYFLDEVVTPSSENDEIFRVQKILYNNQVGFERAGIYDDEMIKIVKEVQKDFVDTYDLNNKDPEEYPEGFDGFKVTGYVDPWTELLIRRRMNIDG